MAEKIVAVDTGMNAWLRKMFRKQLMRNFECPACGQRTVYSLPVRLPENFYCPICNKTFFLVEKMVIGRVARK